MKVSRAAGNALGLLFTGVAVALFVWGRFPWRVEGGFVDGLGPLLQRVPTAITAPLPFSLAEGVEAALLLAGAAVAVQVIRALARGRGHRPAILARTLRGLWLATAVAACLFYGSWGLAYTRPSADRRFGWADDAHPLTAIEPAELAALGEALVTQVNEAYLDLHGWPDAGVVSRAPGGVPALDRAIDAGYERMVVAESLDPTVARSRGPAKMLASSTLVSYLGIGGFYFPFTAEANVNALQPEWQMAHTIAHEKAHQRFVASEDEANFYGFLAGAYSDDPFARYGCWLFAQRQVLVALGESDPYAARDLIARRFPGVQRDIDFGHAFWARYEGPWADVGQAVNDGYLRFNGVEGGVRSYSRSLVLVVEWLRRHPGALDAPLTSDAHLDRGAAPPR